MTDQTTPASRADEIDEPRDDSIGARIKIDYEEIMAATEPDQPGGRIVYSSANYATEEEADAAFEAFVNRIVEAPYEET